MCYNAVDRHVLNGDGDNIAMIYDSAYTNVQEKWTYKDICNRVGRLGNILQKKFGV
jgi:propionyl-CoA synthetase